MRPLVSSRPPFCPTMTKEWEYYRDTILAYYQVQNRTLKDVQKIMRDTHDFDASYVCPIFFMKPASCSTCSCLDRTRAYRSKFKEWKVEKYIRRRSSSDAANDDDDAFESPAPPVGTESYRGESSTSALLSPTWSATLLSPTDMDRAPSSSLTLGAEGTSFQR